MEFAIVVPLLLMILLAMVDFGRMFYVQVSLAAASREGTRAVSLGRAAAEVNAVVQASAPGVSGVSSLGSATSITVSQQACTTATGARGAVEVSVPFDWFTPLELLQVFQPGTQGAQGMTLRSRSEMLCLG